MNVLELFESEDYNDSYHLNCTSHTTNLDNLKLRKKCSEELWQLN